MREGVVLLVGERLVLLRPGGLHPGLVPHLHHNTRHQRADCETLTQNIFVKLRALSSLNILTCAAILPRIITCDAAESRLPNFINPLTRKPVVRAAPMGIRGFSLNFLINFSLGVSWCFTPVVLSTANCLLSWNGKFVQYYQKTRLMLHHLLQSIPFRQPEFLISSHVWPPAFLETFSSTHQPY